jgi:hypothetical protein
MKHFLLAGNLTSISRLPESMFAKMHHTPSDTELCDARGIEIHEHAAHWRTGWLPSLRAFHRRQPCCRVLVTTRIREPLAYYVSLFQWAQIMNRFGPRAPGWSQHTVWPARKADPQFRNPNLTVAQMFEWWSAPNMQSANLLWDSFRGHAEGMLWSGNEIYLRFNATHHAQNVAALRHDFDLVWPLERHAEGLHATIRRLGFDVKESVQAKLGAIQASPGWGSGRRYKNSTAERLAATTWVPPAHICPNATRCRELIGTLAPFDAQLYQLAQQLFAR